MRFTIADGTREWEVDVDLEDSLPVGRRNLHAACLRVIDDSGSEAVASAAAATAAFIPALMPNTTCAVYAA